MFRKWVERWIHWVGDRDMEIAIRAALTRDGLPGNAAKLAHVRLVAVQRPGWVQVYSFDAVWEDQQASQRTSHRFGLVKQDERYDRAAVKHFETRSAREAQLRAWSDGLHRLRS